MGAAAAAQRQALQGQAFGIAAAGASMYGFLRPAIEFETAMDKVAAVSRASDEDRQKPTVTARAFHQPEK